MIPCILVIYCANQQALDLLSTSGLPDVRMQRKLKTDSIRGHDISVAKIPGKEENIPFTYVSWTLLSDAERGRESGKRTLQGELSLPLSLIPSFTLGASFSLKVRTMTRLFYSY